MRSARILLAVSVLASSCFAPTQGFVVVSGVTGAGSMATPGKFVILPGIPGPDTTDQRFREVRGYVTRVLQSRGLLPASSMAEADVAVFARYGVGEPQVTTTVRGSPVVTGWVPAEPTMVKDTTFGAPAGWEMYRPTPTGSDMGGLGVSGADTRSSSQTTSTRWLELVAVDAPQFRRDGSVLDMWRTRAVSTGRSGDLGLVLPYLVVSLAPYVGRDIPREMRVSIDQHDKRVKALREP